MSASYVSNASSELGRSAVNFAWSKWVGGADGSGPYHVWAMSKAGDWDARLIIPSQHAVVDDFGNLVRVPS